MGDVGCQVLSVNGERARGERRRYVRRTQLSHTPSYGLRVGVRGLWGGWVRAVGGDGGCGRGEGCGRG